MRAFREKITDQDARQKVTFGARFKRFCVWLGNGLFLLLCAVGTAWLVCASFPRNSHPELAWFALAPFIWGVTRTKGFWSSFFYAWFTALLFHAGVFYWIYYTCLHGGGLSQGLSVAAWLGLSGLLSVQFAIFGGSCYFLKKTGCCFPLLAACGFVALEWLHQTLAFYGLGFPWLMLGYTQWNAPEILQIVSFTGVYGLSFALAFTGASIGWAFALPDIKRGVGHMCAAAVLFLGLFMFGHYRLPAHAHRPGKALLSVNAALMQPNIDQYKKWNEAFEAEITNTLSEMGDSLTGENVMLALWPESAVPGTLLEERYFDLFKRIAAESGAYQLLGSNVPEDGAQYVGAYLLSPDGDDLQSYRKIKLVPFGEYIPLENWIRKAFPEVEVLGELGSFTPGERGQKLFDLGGVALARTVCYESIFPQLWVAQNRQGAKFFVNITNDAWFFNTAAPYQHLAINAVRAAEVGRPVLRAANTGFSAVIDPFGRIEQKTDLFTRSVLRAHVALPVGDRVTFYTQWGDWFAWLCAIIYFTLFISVAVFSYE